jgi:hypothetical protein
MTFKDSKVVHSHIFTCSTRLTVETIQTVHSLYVLWLN